MIPLVLDTKGINSFVIKLVIKLCVTYLFKRLINYSLKNDFF